MQLLFLTAPLGAVIALGFAVILVLGILKREEGTPAMKAIAQAVLEGAAAYIKRQYAVVAIFFGIIFVVLCVLAFVFNLLPQPVPFAFLTGGFFSALSGFIGLKVATNSSARTTNAAKDSLNSGLRVAFSSGMVMGLVVVGLALLDLSIWYFVLNQIYKAKPVVERLPIITSTMLNFGMGASFYALFARVGGGIFTKAADVGADLVGKVEAGIPEDDPRNPAVIADNVGDNVGDVAGMGADLYESYADSIVATMALATAAVASLPALLKTEMSLKMVLLPMMIAGVGLLASVIGFFLVRAGERAEQKVLLWALRRGIWVAAGLTAVAAFMVVWQVLGLEYIGVFFSVLTGLVAGVILGFLTEYFTSTNYRPTRGISKSAETGPATVIIEGLSVGMISAAPSVLVVAAAVLGAYYFSYSAGGANSFNMGLYGVGIAAVGMLSTLGITLATDAYGPVADNAGGNAQMAGLKEIVRKRTDALDALGNTTAATGKGFAIGSAALTALALVVAYRDEILSRGASLDLSLTNPRLLVGIFLGAMLVFLIAALIMRAIGSAAQSIVKDVRHQFKTVKGLMEGTAKPNYAETVRICTVSAQKQMIAPALSAILAPVVAGILIGLEGAIGLLVGAITTGFAVAIFMANSGGAWDNAKKYIEEGHFGGKGSESHKAGVVGDTVGDPFKDAAGPALNILIKLMSMVSIVFLGLVLAIKLF
jgi:K(+)-stimulated pyrophosphate-energized sodium pump